MPRKLRSPKTRISTELSIAQRRYLLDGCYFASGEAFESKEAQREAWQDNRAELLAEWVSREPQLFCRPSGFWAHDAPEGRRLITGKENSERSREWFGIPAAGDAEEYETQFNFLRRHSELLTEAEREARLNEVTIRWRSMPCSEMAEESYVRVHLELLSDNEREVLEAHQKANEDIEFPAGGRGDARAFRV